MSIAPKSKMVRALRSICVSVVVSLLLSPVSLTAAPQGAAPAANALIVPGTSIGLLRVGMSKENVIAVLGHPDRVTPIAQLPDTFRPAGGVRILGDDYDYPSFGIDVFISLGGYVANIRTSNPATRTREGLGPKSPLSAVLAVLGSSQNTECWGTIFDAQRAGAACVPFHPWPYN